ncbi:Ferri-bacillibactin esterase BesA [Methylorubrum aminovorans]|uniref:Acyl-CoA:diacylglycerol acyltransferase n=1 Tax=Methylorubrum aminovorans TaxID=269069 RepID=A0ABQ4UPL8_9HYPH|nr:alpha/beta hydrolase-fold protein [Methylorubrum aminovorans]GJE68317.1 Ferri-bacillibactin esterase BesA [Methylorubrum aminovorans]GMA74308.1 esterase [Methylorubrum aminovorans]
MTRLSRRAMLRLSMKFSLGLAAGIGLSLRAPARAATEADGPAVLPGTVRFALGAGEGRAHRRITLYVPPGEAPAAGWPCLTLLDGNALAGTAIDIERVQAAYPPGSGVGSRFAIVAIGSATEEAYDSVARSWDYTPPPGRTYPPYKPGGPELRTGGAAAFLEFVTRELRDEIARRCPINRSRQALFGHSFGGLFVLYALVRAPDAFSHWIAASPSIFWEDGSLLPSIDAFEKGSPVCAQLLLLAGAYEAELAPFQQALPDREQRLARLREASTVERARAMAERLGRHPGVTSRFQLIPGRTHMSVLPEALNEAAAFAFPIHPESCPSEGLK